MPAFLVMRLRIIRIEKGEKMNIKIKSFLCCAAFSVSLAMGTVSAGAEEIKVESGYKMYDNICGKVSIIPNPESDTYVQIYKITQETPDSGDLVYDHVIKADSVKEDDSYVYMIECNTFNDETAEYESLYMLRIGVPKYKNSSELMYYSQSLYVDNTDYFSVPTELSDVYIYNINLTQDSLSTPSREIASISSDNRVKTYNLTFMSRDFVAGDANQDGELNIRDAAYIAKMLAAQQGDQIPASGDYNGDGKVDIRDAAAIAKFLSKRQ